MPRWPERTFEQRFMAHVPEQSSGCMEWRGAVKGNGYGHIIGPEGKHVMAHRAMWASKFGPIPAGQFVLHACDNRKCVNPEHLFLGNNSDNVRDMVAKGRKRLNGKACAAITASDRAAMRDAYSAGGGTMREIATRFGCSYGAARSAILGLVA